ncbi:hypothetical protein PAL_GLEAN10023513 [Pteropus alecto]|uniref:Uncharacterized protein n=1 Tax=Pteropus alecto TaxID=9402 RepID=L5K3X4_PTEAL|nr:hypothetical protein PAL_GLEAN10023513 [Pteropus alecto]
MRDQDSGLYYDVSEESPERPGLGVVEAKRGPPRVQTRGHVHGARSLPLPSLPSATAACPAERWTLLVPPYCI